MSRYYVITARSGRRYLVSYSGRTLNSCVFPPGTWREVGGLSYYPQSGDSLGGGSARWVHLKATWAVFKRERVARRKERAAVRDARFISSRNTDDSGSGS